MSLHDWIIYQLIDSRSPGGIETHVLNLSKWLNKNGYRSQVIFLKDHGEHPLKQQLINEGISWRCLNSYKALFHLVTHSPCLLSTHGYKAGIVGRVIGKLCKTPVVSTFHSGDLGAGKLKFYSYLDSLTAVLADRAISVSPEIAARLPISSNQIMNFITPQSMPVERGNQIAFVGRLSSEKGPDSFARITAQLGQPANCHIYGDGPMAESLQQRYPHLSFHGHVDMEEHWQKIGLLCISSESEGLPLAALEAMTRGIPVASYRIGALPQLICHNKNGWLIPPGDEAAFQSVLERWILSSATKKAELSVNAHQQASRHFSDDAICPSILQMYIQALHHKGHLNLKTNRALL